MNDEVVITGAGVGSLVAARLLNHAGYNLTLSDNSYPRHHIIFKDTFFGAIEMTGDAAVDGRTLEALEPGARSKLAKYHESASPNLLKKLRSTNVYAESTRLFSTTELQKIMQYPLLFAGLNPRNIPVSNHVSFSYKSVRHAQSAIIIHVTTSEILKNLHEHTVVLSKSWDENINAVFNSAKWPSDPSFYIGKLASTELTIQIPVTSSATYTQSELAHYTDWVIKAAEQALHTNIKSVLLDITVTGPVSRSKTQS